jgi:C6 transcription factor Pro1
VRRKKCDENGLVCAACTTLHIPCHNDQAKPPWMDGGGQQEAMAQWLKREIRDNAHRRRNERADIIPPAQISVIRPAAEVTNGAQDISSGTLPPESKRPSSQTRRKYDCTVLNKSSRDKSAFSRSDTVLMMFYLDSVFPVLFPFYRPTLPQGGKAWVLEMMISSPVVRQATLCQSSYYLSLAQGTDDREGAWDVVLAQTREAFSVLRQAFQIIGDKGISGHLHGAVRIMSSILQLQRFEVAIMSFGNCQAHLGAAAGLFQQLLGPGVLGIEEDSCSRTRFDALINRLGPPSLEKSIEDIPVPSTEQAAFNFSSALLIFDDIIASTALQETPRLHD